MLIGIPDVISPELLHIMASLGHGDELAIVDRNYPAASTGRRVVYANGTDACSAVTAILRLLPLDTSVPEPVLRMEVVEQPDEVPQVQRDFLAAVCEATGRDVRMGSLARFQFYDRVRAAYAIVVTSESRPYGCFILSAGVV